MLKKNDMNFSIKQIDDLIKSKFTVSYMSDSKWEKLVDGITDKAESLTYFAKNPEDQSPLFFRRLSQALNDLTNDNR